MQRLLAITAALMIATPLVCLAPLAASASEAILQLAQSTDNSLVLYSEDEYQGNAAPFEGQQANLSVLAWNNEAESMRIREGDVWEICTEPDFRYCIQVDSNIPDLSKVGLNREISSIRPIKQNDPAFITPLLGRTASFFPTPRLDHQPVPACPTGGTKKACVQKQAAQFCQQQGYKESAHFVNNDGVLEDVVCKY